MKKAVSFMLAFLVWLGSTAALAQAMVPGTLPDDLGGKTLYGYLMDLKSNFLPEKVFQDATKYTDENRENATRAATLIVSATTAKMAEAGSPDPYMLYLRAYATDLLYQASGDAALREQGLADYKQVVELGGAYAQADYNRLAAFMIKAGPLRWQVPQMLTLGDMAAILGVAESDLLFVDCQYATEDGSHIGAGFSLRSAADPAAAAILVLADPQGGKARYDVLKSAAFLGRTESVAGIGDEALLMGVRNLNNRPALYTALLARKEELVLRVLVPYAVWSGEGRADAPAQLARAIASALLKNLYDTQRSVPAADGLVMEAALASAEMNAGTPDSPVPDAVPTDLGGKTEYGYLTALRQDYLPASAYGNVDLPASDRNNARRAARLIADSITRSFDLFGQNPYELEMRASCYKFAYQDGGEAVFRALAINDYKQAMSTGYLLGRSDYEALAAPLLSPMAEMRLNAEGAAVTLLQQWLMQVRFLDGPATGVFDEATEAAVKLYESENGLTEDGIADIALLLSLYARVDDLDAPLP